MGAVTGSVGNAVTAISRDTGFVSTYVFIISCEKDSACADDGMIVHLQCLRIDSRIAPDVLFIVYRW